MIQTLGLRSTRYLAVFFTGILMHNPPAFAAGCDLPMFSSGRLFAAGATPNNLTTADFNQDGRVDVVVSSPGANMISVMLSNGNGTFQPAVNYPVPNARNIVVADFNGDGKLDLAIASTPNTVVMLGNGDGTFNPGITTAEVSGAMAVGDFNGDGKPDLAVEGAPIYIILGNGDGTFQRPIFNGNSLQAGFAGVVTGDFNGDGKLDVITGATGGIFVMFGDGTGNLSNPGFYNTGNSSFGPSQVAAGDLNGDHIPDVVTLSPLDGSIYVLLGNKDGTFQPSTTYAVGNAPGLAATAMVMADLNGDSKLDLAVNSQPTFNSGVGTVTVFSGNGDGTLQTPVQYDPVSQAITAMGVGDFNSDGFPDLVFTMLVQTLPTQLGVMFGNASGTFQSPVSYPSGPMPGWPILVDLNGDGVLDMAVVDSGFSGNLAVLIGNGDGTFQPATYSLTAFGAASVAAGDFNGDGKPDLAVANGTGQNVLIFLGNGDGTFMAPLSVNAGFGGAYYLAAGDFNRDGNLDLVVVGLIGGAQILLGNGDGTFHAGGSSGFGLGAPVGQIVAADLNGDGNLDVVIANSTVNSTSFATAGTVTVLLGKGDGTFQAGVNYTAGTKATSVAVGDLNGDGRLDLAVADYGSGNVAVLLGNGDGTFQTAVKYAVLAGANSVVIGDFDGDGNNDLAVASSGAQATGAEGLVTMLLGNGDGTFRNALTYGAGSDSTSLAVGDVNGDGKLDVVFADDLANSLVVLLNNYAAGSSGSVCTPVTPLGN